MQKPIWVPLMVYHEDDHTQFVASETKPDKWYQVFWEERYKRWKCACSDFLHKKRQQEKEGNEGEPIDCKHITVYLKHITETEGGQADDEEIDTPLEHGETVFPATPTNGVVPPAFSLTRWVKQIHGKNFIEYEGLLALAHERGLVELGCAFISVTDTLALAFAWAKFCSGRMFWDAGDATPNNVHAQVKAHFPV
jgi:hypothetical protein